MVLFSEWHILVFWILTSIFDTFVAAPMFLR